MYKNVFLNTKENFFGTSASFIGYTTRASKHTLLDLPSLSLSIFLSRCKIREIRRWTLCSRLFGLHLAAAAALLALDSSSSALALAFFSSGVSSSLEPSWRSVRLARDGRFERFESFWRGGEVAARSVQKEYQPIRERDRVST